MKSGWGWVQQSQNARGLPDTSHDLYILWGVGGWGLKRTRRAFEKGQGEEAELGSLAELGGFSI